MKTIYFTCILTLTVLLAQAQLSGPPDSLNIKKEERKQWLQEIKEKKIKRFSDSLAAEPARKVQPDTTRYNRYGDLLQDDPTYNPKQPIWKPIAQAAGVNLLFMGYNRFVARADYAYVSPSTWKRNLTSEPEWDTDEFGINFIGHPYQGTLYFNAARSQGYNYWQSLPFAVAGSVTWEYFGENTLPSYNDLVYTPLNGAALGEILYRVSSNILDDRTSGRERVMREIAAGILNPVRGLNRLLQGKTTAVTNTEMYEKEPLNLTILGGIHRLNEKENDVFGEGRTNSMLSVQLDYGNPYELQDRKPFDLFRLRTEFSFGKADTVGGTINNITGYGLLFGKNMEIGPLAILTGAFQHYDYWDNRNFELGALGFGGGVFTRLLFGNKAVLYTNAHLGVVPLAGNSNRSALYEQHPGLRNYAYTSGFMGKIESTLNLTQYASASMVYYHFWLNTFEGIEGTNSIGIVRPRVTVKLLKNLSVGYEHFGYSTNRKLDEYPDQFSVITDQKVFLQLFLEDPQRRGRYN